MKRKGMATIWGLVFLVVALVMFAGLQPVLSDLIDDAIPISDTLTAAVLRLLLPIVVIAILIGFLAFVLPQREAAV